MFDTWIDAYERNEVSAVLMLDMSAAFDLVDHEILHRKLELYGFSECANINCHACRGLYDDSTFSLSSGNMEELNDNLDKKYHQIAKYMDMNRLILNSEKTHLLIMTSARKHANHQDFGIYLDTGSEQMRKNYLVLICPTVCPGISMSGTQSNNL